jgi:hypothetical protein
MNDDRLLRELGLLAREEERAEKARFDERWDRLAAGTLTAEEEAELRALAETSPEAREAWEAFRPLGPEFQARVVESIAAELPKEARGRLIPFCPAARIGGWVTATAAAAACLFVLLRSPASEPALPVYTAELSGGAQAWRGDEPNPAGRQPVFVPGSMMTLVARPSKPVDGRRLDARGFLGPQTGRADLVRWKPEQDFEIADDGAVRLRGNLGEEIQLARGEWTVWIVIGSKGRVPSASELQSELLAGRTRQSDWRAVCSEWLARQTVSNRPWQVACANFLIEDQPPT